ncbi:hypothetical protein [Streptomyces sp. NRRL F-5630]|uniref:hypothetical protein n=1 Tax=Streptomyces sp. NRRL F-5630 TaxID=1463864 RepID=UPI003EB74853
MASALGVIVNRSTTLRLLDPLPEPEALPPRVVGVNEFTPREGRVYGAVLVDV